MLLQKSIRRDGSKYGSRGLGDSGYMHVIVRRFCRRMLFETGDGYAFYPGSMERSGQDPQAKACARCPTEKPQASHSLTTRLTNTGML